MSNFFYELSSLAGEDQENTEKPNIIGEASSENVSSEDRSSINNPPKDNSFFDSLATFTADPEVTPEQGEEQSFFDGLWTITKSIPSIFTDVAPEVMGRTLRRGDESLKESGLDRWIETNKKERERRKTLTEKEKEQTWLKIPFTDQKITHGDLESAADSLGYSLVNAIVSFGAKAGGSALAGLTGSTIPIVGTAAGMATGFAAGTAVSQGATKDEFIDRVKEQFLAAHKDEKITPELENKWKEVYDIVESDADWVGLWEAGGETIGNLFMGGVLNLGKKAASKTAMKTALNEIKKKAASQIGKNLALKTGLSVGKLATVLTEEMLGETITQKKTSHYETIHGLRDKELTYEEAFKEVLSSVLLTTPLMMGGMKIASRGVSKIQDKLTDETTQDTEYVADDAGLSNKLKPTQEKTKPNLLIEQLRQGYEDGEFTKDALETMLQGLDANDLLRAEIQEIYSSPIAGTQKEHPINALDKKELKQQRIEDVETGQEGIAPIQKEITKSSKKEVPVTDKPIIITNIKKQDRRKKEASVPKEQREGERRDTVTRENFEAILEKVETVDEARGIARQMAKKAYIDPLTKLHNKAAWIESSIKEDNLPEDQKKEKLMIDIDNFSWVNDVLGHDAGDQILKSVGDVINRFSDNGYRYGGEELIITGDSKKELEDIVKKIKETLKHKLKIRYKMEADRELSDGIGYKKGEELFLSGIGISYGIDKDLKNADLKMIDEKENRLKQGKRSVKGSEIQRLFRKSSEGAWAKSQAKRTKKKEATKEKNAEKQQQDINFEKQKKEIGEQKKDVEKQQQNIESQKKDVEAQKQKIKETANKIAKKVQQKNEEIKKLLSQIEKRENKPGLYDNVEVIASKNLNIDPEKFQYKQRLNQKGISAKLKNVQKWDKDIAGILSVWKDPKDGKIYVVNGHHRFELLQRLEIDMALVRFLSVKTEQEAKNKGALINIAEGQGTAEDAAMIFKALKLNKEQLLEEYGIATTNNIAQKGMALAQLAPELFNEVNLGRFPQNQGVLLGDMVKNHDDQRTLFKLINKKKKSINIKVLEQMIFDLQGVSRKTEIQQSLFGDEILNRPLIIERAKIKEHIVSNLIVDKKLFGLVSAPKKAERLSSEGFVVDTEKGKQISQEADLLKKAFDVFAIQKGQINDIINQYAKELSNATSPADASRIKKEAYGKIRQILPAAIKTRNQGISGGDKESDRAEQTLSGDTRKVIQPTKHGLELEKKPKEEEIIKFSTQVGIRQPLTVDSIKKAFSDTGSEIGQDKEGNLWFQYPGMPKVKILTVDSVGKGFAITLQKGQIPRAAYISSKDNIRMEFKIGGISDLADIGSLFHEQWHLFKDMGVVLDSDLKIIHDAIREDGFDGKLTEEKEAEFIGEMIKGRLFSQESALGKIVQKLLDIMDSLRNLIGQKTIRSIEKEIASGKFVKKNIQKEKLKDTKAIRFQMAGEKAIGADKGALSKAQKMLADGIDKKEVWRNTGWLKGAEKEDIWKFEIDDSKAKFNSKVLQERTKGVGTNSLLSEILTHDKLYKNYPQLKNLLVSIEVNPDIIEEIGSYLPAIDRASEGLVDLEAEIEIKTKSVKEVKSFLFHEIQHVIQDIEGFATGGSVEQFQINTIQGMLSGVSKQYQRLLENKIQYEDFLTDQWLNSPGSNSKKEFIEKNKNNEFIKQLLETLKNISIEMENAPKTAFEAYKKLAGEIEARDTSVRAKLTAIQRREKFPYEAQGVPESEWIVTKGKGTNFQVAKNKNKPIAYEIKEKQPSIFKPDKEISHFKNKSVAKQNQLDLFNGQVNLVKKELKTQKTRKKYKRIIEKPVQKQTILQFPTNPNIAKTEKTKEKLFKLHASQHIHLVDTGKIKAESMYVENIDDVASLMGFLGKKAQEWSYVISVDKNNKILQIQEHSKGFTASTNVKPLLALMPAMRNPKTNKIYFVHNHPSESAKSSKPDRATIKKFNKLLSLTKIKQQSLIIANKKYVSFDEMGDIAERPVKTIQEKIDIAFQDREKVGNFPQEKAMLNSHDVLNFTNKNYPGKTGIVFRAVNGIPLGFLEYKPGVPARKLTLQILSAGERVNASSIVFVDTSNTIPHSKMEFIKSYIVNFNDFLPIAGVQGVGGTNLMPSYPRGGTTAKFALSDELIFSKKSKGKEKDKKQEKKNLKTKKIPETDQLTKSLAAQLKKELPENMFVAVDEKEIDNKKRNDHKLIEKAFNKKIIYFQNNNPEIYDFNGVVAGRVKDTIFINTNNTKPMLKIIGHEAVHELKKDNIGLYEALESALIAQSGKLPGYTDKVIKLKKEKGTRNITGSIELEEIIGDYVGDQLTNKEFFGEIFQKDKTLFNKIIGYLKKLFDSFAEKIKKDKNYYEATAKDVKETRDLLTLIFNEYKTARQGGAQIFVPEKDYALDEIQFSIKDKFDLIRHPIQQTMGKELRSGEIVGDFIIRKLQDKFIRLKRLQEILNKNKMPHDLDVFLATKLFPGKVGDQLKRFEEKIVDPLLEKIAKAKIDIQELDDYVYAKHALEERNEIKGTEQTSGSGMTNKEAREILKKFDDEKKATRLKELAKDVYAINEKRLKMLYNAGMISKQTYNNVRNKYDFYVPLRGKDGEPVIGGVGRGFDVFDSGLKYAMGRESRAQSPVAWSIVGTSETIIKIRQHEVSKKFLNLVRKYPNPDLWSINKSVMKKKWDKKTQKIKKILVPAWAQNQKNFIHVYEDGVKQYIKIEDPLVRKAMLQMNAQQVNILIKTAAKINRYFATVYTALDPEFILKNAFKDAEAAAFNLGSEHPKKILKNVIKDYPKAMRSLYRGYRKKDEKKGNVEWNSWQKLYHAHGGAVGFFGLKNFDAQAKEIEKKIKITRRGNKAAYKKALNTTFAYITDVNKTVENTVRLSAFKNLVESGMSMPDAAMYAKELTINFNDKGEWSDHINAAYLFFNVGVQGPVRAMKALKSKRGKKIAASVIATAFGVTAMNYFSGGVDPDDDEPYYFKISEHTRRNNFLIMNPFSDEGDAFSMPLPYVYNIFWVAGEQLFELAVKKDPAKAAENMFKAMMQAYNPLGADESLTRMLTPTVLDMPLDIERNKNFAGYPIKPTEHSFTKIKKPESELYFKSVNPYLKAFSKWVNKASGGNEIEPGKIDISPEILEYLVDVTLGGIGKFATRVTTTTKAIVKKEPVEVHKVPFARTFYKKQTDIFLFESYNKAKTNIYRKIASAKKGYREDTDKLKNLKISLDQTEKRLRKIYQQIKVLEGRKTLPDNMQKLLDRIKKEAIVKKKKIVKEYEAFKQQQ